MLSSYVLRNSWYFTNVDTVIWDSYPLLNIIVIRATSQWGRYTLEIYCNQFRAAYGPRSKFIVYIKCVIKLVRPLSFYQLSCFYIIWQLFASVKHSFEARPLGSSSLAIFVCARWRALVLLPVPVWSSFALLGQSLQTADLLERKWVSACFGHSQLLTSKFIQPGHRSLVHHYNILPTSATCSASFVTRALLERFSYRLGIVLGIVLRGLHLCKSHACETEWIARCGIPKLGQAAKRDTAWSWPLQHAYTACE